MPPHKGCIQRRLSHEDRLTIANTLRRNPSFSLRDIWLFISQTRELDFRTVVYFVNKWNATGSIKTVRNCVPTKLTPDVMRQINDIIQTNREISLVDLKKELNLDCNCTSLSKARRKLGWIPTQTRYCAFISPTNQCNRLSYATKTMARGESFNDVIFADECVIEVSSCARLRWRLGSEECRFQRIQRSKHVPKLAVFAGISRRGATSACCFTGLLDADGLTQVLDETLLPFVNNVFPRSSYRLYWDNDPKHKSATIQDWLCLNNVRRLHAPAQSPDLNPIEMLWNQLKRYLERYYKPKNLVELASGIELFWSTQVTPDLCNRYISHLYKVIPKVILTAGDHSGY